MKRLKRRLARRFSPYASATSWGMSSRRAFGDIAHVQQYDMIDHSKSDISSRRTGGIGDIDAAMNSEFAGNRNSK
jgi:hypothetical protein